MLILNLVGLYKGGESSVNINGKNQTGFTSGSRLVFFRVKNY